MKANGCKAQRKRGEREKRMRMLPLGLERMVERIGNVLTLRLRRRRGINARTRTWSHVGRATGKKGKAPKNEWEGEGGYCGTSRAQKEQNECLMAVQSDSKGNPIPKSSPLPPGSEVRSANTISEGCPRSLLTVFPGDHETWARTDGRSPRAQTPLRPSSAPPFVCIPNHCCST